MSTKNLKPFDLQAALNGEAVMLQNGQKAYVRHHETEARIKNSCQLLGFAENKDVNFTEWRWWTQEGICIGVDVFDIVGMWPKTRIINGFEVPAPETEVLKNYADFYIVAPADPCLYNTSTWTGLGSQRIWLARGLIFLKKEDAVTNAKAMLGIDLYEEER